MDKKIKYVGSAVAAALMVAGAPIIVPTLIPTSIIKAATTNNLTPSDMLAAFKNQFDDRYFSSANSVSKPLNSLANDYANGYHYFDINNPYHIHDFENNDQIRSLMDANKQLPASYFYNGTYLYRDMLVAMTVADKDGNNIDISTGDKLKALSLKDSQFPLTATIHVRESKNDSDAPLTSIATVTDPTLLDFSFAIKLSKFDITTDTNLITTNVGTFLTSLQSGNNKLAITDNYTGDSKYANSLAAAEKPILGQSLFRDLDSARKYAGESDFNPSVTNRGNASTEQFSDGKIKLPGQYYQTVSYNLKGADTPINNMLSSSDTVDPLTGSHISPYQTFINGSDTEATAGTDYVFNHDVGTITVIRKISVGASIKANLETPQVKINSLISDSKLATNNTLSDGVSNVDVSNVEFGDDYYTDRLLKTKATSDQISSTNFVKPGKYYRKIIFTLKNSNIGDYSSIPDNVGYDTTANTVTYVQEVDVKDSATTKYDNPLNANVGDASTSGIANDTLTNGSSNLVQTNGISFGNNYYEYGGQASALQDDVLNDSSDLSATDGVVDSTGKFAKSGDYLRTITYTLVANSVDTNTFDTTNSKYKLGTDSKGNDTITYVQKVHVSPLSSVNVNYGSVELMAGATTDDPALASIDGDTLTFGTDKTNLIDTTKGSNKNGIDFGQQYFKTLSNGKLSDPVTNFSEAGTYYRTIKFYVNKDVDSINFNGTTGTTDSSDNSVTFIQTINVEPIETAVNFNVPSVSIGATSTSDINALNDTTTDTLKTTDDAATSLIDTAQGKNGISFGTDYYTDMGLKNKATNGLSTGSGTYYRKITFYLNRDTSELSFDKTPYDKTSNSVTFIQPVSVNVATVVEKIDTVSSSIGSSVSSAVLGDNDLTSNKVSIVDTTQTSVGNEYFTRAEDAVKGENSQGTSFKSSGKVYRTITFTLKNPASYYSFDGTEGTDYKIDGNKITFAQPILINTATAVPKLSTESVQNGSLISDSEKASNDLTVNGSSIVATNGVSYGTDYYSVADNKPADILNGQGKAASGVTDGTNFTKSGDYYRVITFALNQNVDANSYAFGDGKLSSDGKSVQYVQEVRVLANSTMVNIPNIITNTGALTTEFDDKTGYDLTSAGNSIVSAIEFGNYYDDVKSAVSNSSTVSTNVDSTNHKFLKDDDTLYRAVTFTLKSDASNYDFSNLPKDSYTISGNKITLAQRFIVEDNPATAKIFTAQGKLNGLVADSETSGNNKLTAKVNSVDTDVFNKITFGSSYYSSSDLSGDPVDITQDGKFIKSGKYYREIIFHLKSGAVDANSFKGSDVFNIGKDKDDPTVSYIQEVYVVPSTTTVNVKHLNVNVGSSTTINETADDGLVDSANNSLVDNSNNDGITFGNVYYTDAQAALDASADKEKIADVGSNFTTAGQTYYRRITFKLNDDAANYTFTDLVNGVGHVKNGNEITFVQAVTVNKSTVTTSISPLKSIQVGISTLKIEETISDQLLDQSGKSIVAQDGINRGSEYYGSEADAIASVNGTATAVVNKGGNFNKPGTYYRIITFTLLNPVDQYNFAGTDGVNYVISKDKKSISFIQSVTASANPTTVTIPDITVGFGSLVSSIEDDNTGDTVIDNGTKESLVDTVKNDSIYYKSASGAMSEDKNDLASIKDKFTEQGDYYRRVTINLKDDVANHDFTDMINGEDPILGDKSVTYIQKVTVTTNAVDQNIETVTAKVGDNLSSVSSGTYDLTINNGKDSIMTNDVKIGKEYYGNKSDAVNGTNALGTTLNNSGTYYRAITFTLENNADSYTFKGKNGVDYKIDGKTVTLVQPIIVGSVTVKASVDPLKIKEKTLTTDSDVTADKGYTLTGATFEKVGTDYYNSLKGALAQDSSDIATNATSGSYFNQGDYYRLVYFKVGPEFAKDYSIADDNLKALDDDIVVYAQPVTVTSATEISQDSIALGTARVGDNISAIQSGTSQLLDSNGKSISQSVSYGTDYYDSSRDVFTNGAKTTANIDGNGNFTKAGTYYREITFKVTEKDIDANNFSDDAHIVKNGDNSTVSFVQTIGVSAGTAQINVNPISVNVGTPVDSIKNTDTLTDKANNSLGTATLDNSRFYDNAKDALDGSNVDTNATTNDLFNKGTYYRLVTFKTASDFAKNYTLNNPNVKVNADGSVIYAQRIDVIASGVVKYKFGVVNANVGDSINNMTKPTGELRDNSNNVIAATVTAGTTYYDNADDVFSTTGEATEGVNANGQFTKSGTYYREISFKLNNAADVKNYDFGTDAHISGDTVSYVQTVVVGEDTATITVGPLNIKTGTRTNDSSVTSTDGYVLTDADGNYTDPTLGETYYKSVKGALDKSNGDEVDASATTNGAFNKGTYYRRVVFRAGSDFADKFQLTNSNVKVDSDGWVIYAQQINVKDSVVSKHTIEDAKANVGDSVTAVTSTGDALMDASGNKLDATVSYGTDYYDNYDDVFIPNAAKTKDIANGAFTKTGTYYRVINFKVSPEAIAQNDFGSEAHISGNTVSFVQAVTVTKNEANINSSVSELDLSVNAEKDNPALINTKEYFLKDAAGNSLVDKTKGTYGVELGQVFYTDSSLTQKTADASGARISKAGTYYRTVKFYLTNGATDANQFESIGGTYDANDKSVTFVQMVKASANPAIAKINNVTVDNGTSMTDKVLQNTDDVYIVDKNGDSIVADGGISFGTTLYDDQGRPVTNLKTAGTYSQVITVKLANDVSAYTFGEGYKVDPTNNTVSYVRTVTVKAASSTGGNTGGSTGGNSGSSTGGESDEDDDWNYSPIQGVVTTKTNHPFYTLNNQDNDKIPNRVLGKDSSWKTDQIRVNKAGVTQYRVATGEWIYADDVVLNQNSSEDGDWTYTPVQGVVTTKTDQKKYQLNNHENETIANRDLKEDSSWKTDLYRTNKEGVKQYRVATGEWIDADDVNFNQDKEDFWTYTSVSGVVKTKDGQTEYQLNDQENKAIAHRDLKEDSSWKTDLYRTNEAGVKQYRVATGEWIDAGDVDFINNNKDDEGWIYTSISGIVTTKSSQANYQLNNQNNSAIAGRELVKDSSWKTDQYRTNREGVKQYRVATGEWVDANDVVYEDAIDTGIFRDGRKVSGIINLDRTNIFYDLYSRENEIIEDYSLGEETSWKTDYKAQDVNGDTYYHVGDNEWIKAEKGVHFNNYAWY
ncbi:hypothetical protein [Companilactobacillus bobalius]|uniref:Uncharacterized protein n=2 Tax=Companilactobacillus bobalius TaxID=2801451 RepID=A0A202F9W5_9LACO|nr:hypothetical protein [Companilactobacillus bobalius]KAE9564355.1 hypothetical protein ATN92_01340 [Companilactobacillus bobalius]KRK84059.1 hypothetical protein FC78_GL001066 [Companilactobacillus bobalius DSM 19674]OVE97252.1 hypothetical protein LKACC16343_01742 [Companilactobacillus bobalius]GEO58363.1 hypothetical protein LBO01_14920 [Companilactobacillus paralimentarius]